MDFIVNMDGTTSNCDHRLHFISNVEGKPKDWDAFYDHCHLDEPIRPVIAVVKALIHSGHRPIFATGRPERIRLPTTLWIKAHIMGEDHPDILMRADNDHRADVLLKADFLKTMKANGYKPLVAFEDRKAVVDLYRREGIVVMHCAEGSY